MPKKRQIKKHSVKAQLQVMELAKAGSSLHLEIYAAREKIGTLILEFGTLSRLTTAETVTSVEWTRDGTQVVYSAVGNGTSGAVWAQSIGGAAPPQMLVETPGLSTGADISPDGRSLLLQVGVETGWDLQRVSLDSSHTFRDFAASRTAGEFAPRFSPDGRWAAIVSDEQRLLRLGDIAHQCRFGEQLFIAQHQV